MPAEVSFAPGTSANERTPLVKNNANPAVYAPAQDFLDDFSDESGDDGREVVIWKPGKSGFGATLLNVLGDLIGTGLLAAPIAIAHAGWVLGPLFLLIICLVTLFTLKILIRIIEKDRRLRNFTDVIGYALGGRGEKIVGILFVIEIAAWIIALIVLYADSLEAVWPIYTSDQWKVVGLVVVIPTLFLPLRLLSYSSALGVFSTVSLIAILIFTGITTPHSPGSIREPAHTDLWPAHGWVKLGTVFGLLIAGFGGHGLIPNLIHDMKNPKQADRVCEIGYGIAAAVYFIVAVFGYLMYGTNVSDEVSKDLARTPGVSPWLNQFAVWMVAINPLTKIALGVRPLADMIFGYFDLHKTILVPQGAPTPRYITRPSSPTGSYENAEDEESSAAYIPDPATSQFVDPGASHFSIAAESRHDKNERFKAFVRPCVRLGLAFVFVIGALIVPSFETVMSLLGSAFAVATMIVIPIWAGATIFGWRWYDWAILIPSVIVGTLGTIATFLG
ncbi:Vacuolar amino acid transporter 1 [Vanrija pseudolonga]|uniref:Vacuolar amino acid transporter 1 n=1 Tax=Vanrija pseudolonga TaxID=143232 RepID=A0AAF0YEB3_9TREE|nr:Vacuolar amino acid transporter 1 [Vanrija pseudolonga]